MSLVEQPASRLTALAVDVVLAVGCYFAAFGLRFDAAEFAQFLPSALRTLPLVVVSQVAALFAFRAYTYRQGRRWFPRLLAGILVGTGAGALLAWLIYGFQGVSRISFAVDALLARPRGVRMARRRQPDAARPGCSRRAGIAARNGRSHRTAERQRRAARHWCATGSSCRNLVLRDVKLKYRGSVFGFFWSLANPILMVVTYTIAFRYIMQVRTEGFVFNLLLGLLNWTFFSSSAMMSTGVGRWSGCAGQERGVSARDSSGGNRPVQPRAIPAGDCRLSSASRW